MSARLEARGAGEYAVQGELVFDSVTALWQESGQLFQGDASVRLDLAGVTRSDSSGVALLVGWLQQARARDREIRFVNVPKQMLAIMRAADLDALLPLA